MLITLLKFIAIPFTMLAVIGIVGAIIEEITWRNDRNK